MKKLIIIILISTLCMCLKCKDSMLPDGIETKVYGNVYDRINDIPVVNHKLIIQEINYEPGFQIGSNINYVAEIDSTYTDANGDYELVFETTGKGDSYEIYSPRTNQIWTYYNSTTNIENIGSSDEINFDFLHLYPVNLTINTDPELNFLPIKIRHKFTLNRSLNDIDSISDQIIRQIYVPLNTTQTVEFYRTKPDGQNQVFSVELPRINNADPFNLEIDLSNSIFEDY